MRRTRRTPKEHASPRRTSTPNVGIPDSERTTAKTMTTMMRVTSGNVSGRTWGSAQCACCGLRLKGYPLSLSAADSNSTRLGGGCRRHPYAGIDSDRCPCAKANRWPHRARFVAPTSRSGDKKPGGLRRRSAWVWWSNHLSFVPRAVDRGFGVVERWPLSPGVAHRSAHGYPGSLRTPPMDSGAKSWPRCREGRSTHGAAPAFQSSTVQSQPLAAWRRAAPANELAFVMSVSRP